VKRLHENLDVDTLERRSKTAEEVRLITRASLIRFGAAIGIAAMLLLLSVIFHGAMASDPANSWAYLWGTWIFVIALTFVIAFSARSVRTALGRLCLLNGGATALVVFVMVGSNDAISDDVLHPGDAIGRAIGGSPAIGSAILSAVLGMIAVACLVVSYILLRVRDGHKNRAAQS